MTGSEAEKHQERQCTAVHGSDATRNGMQCKAVKPPGKAPVDGESRLTEQVWRDCFVHPCLHRVRLHARLAKTDLRVCRLERHVSPTW